MILCWSHHLEDTTFYFRYCMKWYKIASERINMKWWDAVLAPLKELELIATEHMLKRQEGLNKHDKTETTGMLGQAKYLAESSIENSYGVSRSCLEDIEMETRALTEPLPTNQQVCDHLYNNLICRPTF